MSLSAVSHAARQESQSDLEVAATTAVLAGKCFLQYAPSVAKTPKCRLSPLMGDRFIVAVAATPYDLQAVDKYDFE